MKRFGIFLLAVAVFLIQSPASSASEVIPNLEALTNLSNAVLEVESLSADEREETIKNIKREVIDYKVMVKGVIKNEAGAAIETGGEFSFTAFAPAKLTPGQSYLICLKLYSYGVWGFVAGDRGIFKIEKGADGKVVVANKFNNFGLMQGVKEGVAGVRAKALGLKDITAEEGKVLNQLRGPVEMNKMVDVIKRIDAIKGDSGK